MNRIAATVLIAASAAASAAQAQTFVDDARVRHVQPQYETVSVPREECTSQWVTEAVPQAQASGGVIQEYGPALIGGAVGAAAGRQVGKGTGRDIATVLGVVAGAYAGDRIAHGNRYAPQPQQYQQREVRQCRTVYDQQSRVSGYQVQYDYRGQVHTALLREHPGQRLPVRVSVEPVQR
ncbi:glycine zipper 2TM domain-containing protein [Ramlibacter sp. AW1]|uniref:Glycine zipper 2TM domain-containing protein n=1 Tax=Ramlibacter aurantiacus TaxID=2801330 RepID=A0A936ZKP9_9BURK|nr:glycine zipper 2TM domain-containing protein [Ramlibacter aurantiacus]MBL0421978.1 glycine zipper 2TM domain-containing protein [Ramlibacter aurantiacus]